MKLRTFVEQALREERGPKCANGDKCRECHECGGAIESNQPAHFCSRHCAAQQGYLRKKGRYVTDVTEAKSGRCDCDPNLSLCASHEDATSRCKEPATVRAHLVTATGKPGARFKFCSKCADGMDGPDLEWDDKE